MTYTEKKRKGKKNINHTVTDTCNVFGLDVTGGMMNGEEDALFNESQTQSKIIMFLATVLKVIFPIISL